jgi:hypothetical protein
MSIWKETEREREKEREKPLIVFTHFQNSMSFLSVAPLLLRRVLLQCNRYETERQKKKKTLK